MPKYRLEFQEGYQFETDPDPYHFEEKDNETAITHAKIILGLTSPEQELTEGNFFRGGAKVLLRKSDEDKWIKVFPVPDTLHDFTERHGEIKEVIYVMEDGAKFALKGESAKAWGALVNSSAISRYYRGIGLRTDSAKNVFLERIN